MEVLTSRQVVVLRFIAEHTSRNGAPPTLREIGRRLGIRSTNGVNDHLKALERKGMLVRRSMLTRSLVLTTAGRMQVGQSPETPDAVSFRNMREALLLAARALRSGGQNATAKAILDIAGLEG